MTTLAKWIVVDSRDKTYYAGAGSWSSRFTKAKQYTSTEQAVQFLWKDISSFEYGRLRDRLCVVPSSCAPHWARLKAVE